MGAFVVFGASSFIPLLHGVQRYGLEYMLQYSGMKWYLLELVLYGTGVGLYAVSLTRSPHRVFPFPGTQEFIHSDEPLCSCDFRSVWHRVGLISGEARTRSFMSPSYAQCTHTRRLCCMVSQPVIHWMCVSFRVLIEQIEAVQKAGLL